ncbi:phosphotransferase [Actinobaculum suis]|uniref:phosphotransferase n=1 Tax=Actinobaculum suis TaxID=1657 RepID=UPI0009F53FED|nr:phosphotransferase [Actinobaculum suis]
MSSSPLRIAALAVGALGIDVVSTRQPYTETDDFVQGAVLDSRGRHWIIKAPKNPTAATILEAEAALAPQLLDALRAGALPFDIMRPAGFVDLEEGGRAVAFPEPLGRPRAFTALPLEQIRSLGRGIASIHTLDPEVVARSGLPVYTGRQWADRMAAELSQAVLEVEIPPILRRRWEAAFADNDLWNFTPTVIHGDVASENFLWSNGQLSTVLGFGEAAVGDPARDLAQLLELDDAEWTAFIESYENTRGFQLSDADFNRIVLTSEMAIVRWLLYGVRTHSEEIRNDAVQMLGDLADQVRWEPPLTEPASPGTAPAPQTEVQGPVTVIEPAAMAQTIPAPAPAPVSPKNASPANGSPANAAAETGAETDAETSPETGVEPEKSAKNPSA